MRGDCLFQKLAEAPFCVPRAGQAPFCAPQYGQAPLCVPAGARTCATARAAVRVFVSLSARKDFCMKSAPFCVPLSWKSTLLRAAVWTSAPVRARRSAYLRYCARVGARVCAPARAERLLHEKRTFSRRGPDKRPCAPPAEPRTPARPRASMSARRDFCMKTKRAIARRGFWRAPSFYARRARICGKNAPKRAEMPAGDAPVFDKAGFCIL